MSVSVLMPVFNGATTLRQAIDSVLDQPLDDLEVLVVDDASTDSSRAIMLEYAARDSRVTVILQDRNMGLAATLNHALERARHELVARMDQDDESLPDRLERQVQFMMENPSIAVAGSFVLNMGRTPGHDRLVELPATPREVGRTLPRENCLYHPSVLMRRSVVLAEGGYRAEFRNSEDYELWLRLSRSHDLANIPVPLVRYRLTPGGMTLARKWEQLYYVKLAQHVYRDPTVSLAEAAERATADLGSVDRRYFMEQVAVGAVTELARLALWEDALRVLWVFAPQIRPRVVASLTAVVARERIRG